MNNAPEILNPNPKPEMELKIFHKIPIIGWAGTVNILNIHGWEQNPRIELFRRRCELDFGRPPSNEEIIDYMVSDSEFEIKQLQKSILNNGVRVPIIIASDGTLLDGNRRYVASCLALKNNPKDKDKLSNIPAWVLTEDGNQYRQKVLVECNYLSDYKKDWPNYIKSLTVYEDYVENHLSYDDLAERYGHQKSEVRQMVAVMGFIQEFLIFNEHSEEAYQIAYDKYVYFEEAYNKVRAKLDSDVDLKERFFSWMIEDKFKRMKQTGRLGEIRDNEEAWAAMCSTDPNAADIAIHIVDGEKLGNGQIDGDKKILKVIKTLKGLKQQEIAAIGQKTLSDLRKVLGEVVGMAEAVAEQNIEIIDNNASTSNVQVEDVSESKNQ